MVNHKRQLKSLEKEKGKNVKKMWLLQEWDDSMRELK